MDKSNINWDREYNKNKKYPPIRDYGVIGNLKTVALVGLNGSVDFMCFPDFDSPSLFARMLDWDKGGFFQITPQNTDFETKQIYHPDTNVLITHFYTDKGILEVTDFMPIASEKNPTLIRLVKSINATINVSMNCQPAFDYARSNSNIKKTDNNKNILFIATNDGINEQCRLQSSHSMDIDESAASAYFELSDGETALFVLSCGKQTEQDYTLKLCNDLLNSTINYWREWIATCKYDGVSKEHVLRSALALKLLFSDEFGAIVASPTFGLPEVIGGKRNWDYRYCWIRDSSFTIYSMLRLGFQKEAEHYGAWIRDRYTQQNNKNGQLKLLYCVDGDDKITETEMSHLEGYRGSTPVRIGNAAQKQLQLDIYGELIDSMYLTHKYATPMTVEGWENTCQTLHYVCENWEREDEGIWEVRGPDRHFLHSRLMCWVALDRGIRLTRKISSPAPLEKWIKSRDAIFNDIHENFWNKDLKTFVQYKGGDTVDASTLLMPLMKFISPVDTKWLSTMAAIKKNLVNDVFVKRYINKDNLDGLDGEEEGSFLTCSFWYAECLARTGATQEARMFFERTCSLSNHVGLFSEEITPNGELIGNFPQAFTHLSLVSAAYAVQRSIDTNGKPF